MPPMGQRRLLALQDATGLVYWSHQIAALSADEARILRPSIVASAVDFTARQLVRHALLLRMAGEDASEELAALRARGEHLIGQVFEVGAEP